MSKRVDKYEVVMTFHTAGYSHLDVLKVWPNPEAQCGTITDGLALQHDDGGAWVLSFADLEKIYLRAKQLKDAA